MGVDRDRVMKISLVHDMAESVVGDITPHCGVSVQDKHTREVNTMKHFKSLLGDKAGGEMMELFFEYETDQDRHGTLEEFFKSTEGVFKHPKIKSWVEELYEQRKKSLGVKRPAS